MLPIWSTIRRYARQSARHIAMRSLVSVGVMVGLQVGTSLSSAPHGDEGTPRLTVRAPLPAAAPLAPVRLAGVGEPDAISNGREARLPVPALLAALAARPASVSVPAAEPVVRMASLRSGADPVMFDTCLPECESRDPLLRKASLAALAAAPAGAPIVRGEAEAEAAAIPVATSAERTHDSLLRVAARQGTTIAGAATTSALSQVVRLLGWRNEL